MRITKPGSRCTIRICNYLFIVVSLLHNQTYIIPPITHSTFVVNESKHRPPASHTPLPCAPHIDGLPPPCSTADPARSLLRPRCSPRNWRSLRCCCCGRLWCRGSGSKTVCSRWCLWTGLSRVGWAFSLDCSGAETLIDIGFQRSKYIRR
ncbi:hypothetical protein BDV12DRAFT_179385 [Aspergillus spectabilis]